MGMESFVDGYNLICFFGCSDLSVHAMTTPHKLPTQQEIARLAGVSQVTVNAVLNGSSHTRTRPETRAQILAIAKKLNYKIQRHARFMRTGKSGSIALLTSSVNVETAQLRQNLAMVAVHDLGYFPKIYDINWYGGDFGRAWDDVLQDRPEGILFVGPLTLMDAGVRRRIAALDTPIVSLSGPRLPNVPLLIPDYQDSFYRLACHLMNTGRQRITLIMRKPSYQKAYLWQDDRRLGFARAMQERSLKPRIRELDFYRPEKPETVISIIRDERLIDNCHYGYDFARAALQKGLKDDAWMFFNDAWAMGALRALGEEKIEVPAAMAVTGCDGENSTRYGYLPITTIVQPIRTLVSEGAEVLIEMMKTKKTRGSYVRKLRCDLQFGATTENH